jgi:adenylate cyclase
MHEDEAATVRDLKSHQSVILPLVGQLGDVIHDETRIYGDGINIAARLEALAEPGGVLVSNTVYDQVRGKLSLTFEDLGERQVKNIEQPVRIYRLHIPGASSKTVPTLVRRPATTHRGRRILWGLAAS